MRVLMIPNDFPTKQEPYRTYFNYLAAKELMKLAELKIIQFRAWLPGRKIVQTNIFKGISVTTVTGPILPNYNQINLRLYHRFVWPFVYKHFKRVDLIHSVGVDFGGIIAGIWAKKTRLHHVTQFIADPNSAKANFDSLPYVNNLSNNLHGIACNSKALVKSARLLFPKVINIKSVYRGVDLTRFNPHGPVSGPLKDCPATRFLFLGGLPSYPETVLDYNTKGGVTLMTAWQEAEEELASLGAHLHFAGPDANNRKSKKWRDGLKFPNNVFLSDEIKPEDVPAQIRAADVVLIPSLSEGLPNLALEAGACARPVFGSDLDCIAEILVHGETGLLIPAGEVSNWKTILLEYADPRRMPQLKHMGICARKRMETCFDYRNYAPNMADLYQKAMECSIS